MTVVEVREIEEVTSVKVRDIQNMTIVEANNDPLTSSMRSAMLQTIFIQMGIRLAAGILIHALGATVIGDAVPLSIWFFGAYMYLSVLCATFWMCRLHAIQPPPRTDLDVILRFDTGNHTVKTVIIRCFRRYNHLCCGLMAMLTFLVALSDLPTVLTANRLDLLKWTAIFGLVAFIPMLAFYIYNLIMLDKYEQRSKKNSVLQRGIRREEMPTGKNETLRPDTLSRTVPTPDEALDTVLRNN